MSGIDASNETLTTALQEGQLSLQGEFLWGSNYTYLVSAEHGEHILQGVYKPTRGTRPLWDFSPSSLARREAAAYLVSQALGWQLVPPTVYRRDGPLGPGSLQLFVEHDPEYHYYNFKPEDRQRLRPTALFDLLTNNADRKGSHILIDPQNHLWLIDHGLCFHAEDKLRTVIWDFAGEAIPGPLHESLAQFLRQLGNNEIDPEPTELATKLRKFLSAAELRQLAQRAGLLLQTSSFPAPDPARRQVPWPPV